MVSETFYEGANYGFDPDYGKSSKDNKYGFFTGYRVNASDIGFPSDPRTANQIKAVSDKLNTGSKVVEVSGVNITGGGGPGGHMELLNSIPKQHFDEIRRLKELAGAELTFHGPLIELSGFSGSSWNELDRQQSEREMWRAVEEGQRLNPKGNTPIVFHTTANLPIFEEKRKTNKGEIVTTQALVINEATGQAQRFEVPTQRDYFETPKGIVKTFPEALADRNKEEWASQLQRLNFGAEQATRSLEQNMNALEKTGVPKEKILKFYKEYVENPAEAQKKIKILGDEGNILKKDVQQIMYSDIYLKDTYNELKKLYNRAYESNLSDKERKLLDEYREKVSPAIEALRNDPSKVIELGEMIEEGVDVLRKVSPPETFKAMAPFIMDKSAETISNTAFKSFKKFGDNSPIIALENPPADRFGFSTAEEMIPLIEKARDRFVEKAVESGMSKKDAQHKANQLIGATWDTGHINALQGLGYTREDVIKQAEKIAPYVKHVHIVDNFGLTDTELPPGMGTAPIKESLELIEGYNNKVKKIIETGAWYSKLGMQKTPVLESFSGLGSSVYAAQAAMNTYWNSSAFTYGAYFSGLGPTNPEIHHSLYGAGFANLPVEQGGQMSGRNRLSGSPTE